MEECDAVAFFDERDGFADGDAGAANADGAALAARELDDGELVGRFGGEGLGRCVNYGFGVHDSLHLL